MATALTEEEKKLAKFRIERTKKLQDLYTDDLAAKRSYSETPAYKAGEYTLAAEVREALKDSVNNNQEVTEASKKLYATNPIYMSVINYMADMYMWRYKVIPQKVYSKSKAKLRKQKSDEDYQLLYNLMLEVVDGLSIETKFPTLLTLLYTTGSVFFTTVCDEDSLTIDTMILPTKYCRKIGETQYGTAIIEFDYSYFRDMGFSGDKLESFLKTFPKEMQAGYRKYVKDPADTLKGHRWQILDPHFSSGVLLNDAAIPTYFYLYGGILDYEQYQDNELERNENMLKYIVVHTMPHYEDRLIFEVDEVAAIHKSLKKIVDTGDKTRLITTYGDVHLEKVGENDTTENQVLEKAFKAIFNNAGFNSGVFTSESVEGLKMSLIRDKAMVWRYVQALTNFYNIAVNNWFDFKEYQANFEILPISSYTYSDDIEGYRSNATLGIGKLDYVIASGIKQKNIQGQLGLEDFLKLNQLKPLSTSYTQTDNSLKDDSKEDSEETDSKDSEKADSGNEPTDDTKEVDKESKEEVKTE